MPKVSVLMSVYNKSEFLRAAMDSVLGQTFGDFEFIIYDNKSTDNSLEILKSYSDPRIRLFENRRNVGPVQSFNNCLEKATGDYVTFAHGDDIWLDSFLETNVALLDRHPDINISHALVHYIDEAGAIRPTDAGGDEFRIVGYDAVLQRLARGCYISTPTAFFRNGSFPFFDLRYIYTWDWDLFFKMAANKNDFLLIDRPLMYYRHSSGNATSAGKENSGLIIESFLTLRNFFGREPAYRPYRRKAFSILAMSALRRSRDLQSRETILLYCRLALFISPYLALNPVFHCYLSVALLFGHKGMRTMRRVSKAFTRSIKRGLGRKP